MSNPTPQQIQQAMLQAEAVKFEAGNIASMLGNTTSYSIARPFLQRDMRDLLSAVNDLIGLVKELDEEQYHESSYTTTNRASDATSTNRTMGS